MPEFPLSLRLIGLRVTKLKDLRGDDRKKKGIKRVSLIYLPITTRSDRPPAQHRNSSLSRLERKRAQANDGGRTERHAVRAMTTTSHVSMRVSKRRQISFNWVPPQGMKTRRSRIVRCAPGH